MTTSISNVAVNAPAEVTGETAGAAAEATIHRVPHTLASRFIFLGLCGAIVLTALAFGTNHNWALAIFNLGALAIVFLWILDGWHLGVLRLSRNPLQLPILGMLLLGLIQLLPLRSAEAVNRLSIPAVKSLSLDPYATTLILADVATLFVYFAATLVFTDTPHRLRILVRTITIFGFMLAIFGLTQSFTTSKVFWIRELTQSTAFGPFINRHHFAGYMELTMALPLGMLFAGSLEKDKRFAYIFAAVLMGVALVMTNSRGGVISLVAEILFLLVMSGFRKRKTREVQEKSQRIKRVALRAAFALSLIVVLFAGVVLLGGESALSRFAGTVNSEDPTTGRAHFWNVTLDIIKAHPVVGTGLGAFPTVYTRYDSRNGSFRLEQVHNDYLQIMSDGGIIGAALGLMFVVMLFRYGFARRESPDDYRSGVALGALAGCFAVLVHSFFDFTLHTTANALLFLVMAALATMNGRVEQPSKRKRRRRRRMEDSGPIMISPG
ncbi:MAG: O-antigen ligase family protein [Pyrinomonadaceae bacterium]